MPRRRKSSGDSNSSVSSSGLQEKPLQRNAANARERTRMRILSKAFTRLKTTLPWVPSDTKLSKLDTLRLASSYIKHLAALLESDPDSLGDNVYPHPALMSWPYTAQKAWSEQAAAQPEVSRGQGQPQGLAAPSSQEEAAFAPVEYACYGGAQYDTNYNCLR
ncbi:transcription factor 21-like [Amphibalanus amphitrite]|uniref:transcription factor 21-like n=1 Tax=Amphibalanus amphitrite TaxID=1232801 RepID=UPI001C91BB11|nr:transcription factor 21-like [Amphibalanus amphitrite]